MKFKTKEHSQPEIFSQVYKVKYLTYKYVTASYLETI